MSDLQILLLGGFRVTLDGTEVTRFRGNTAQALLAYLAMHPGVAFRRLALASLLWPDHPESEALRNLRQALFRLRTAIRADEADPPVLRITHTTVAFDPEGDPSTGAGRAYWLDTRAFGDAIAASERHAHRRIASCSSCARRLSEAMQLYGGDFLAGFSLPSTSFEEWIVVEREHMHRQALEALGHLVAYHEGREEYEEAAGYARRQLGLEPWLEEAHRGLMRALALSGQRGEALAQYEVCQKILMEELGVEPEPETRELVERIRGRQDLTGLGNLSGLHNLPAEITPFIGRRALLDQITDRLADPGCRMLTLVGPGGSGKTRLALEAARRQVGGYPDGVYWVALAGVGSVNAIVPTVAGAVGFPLHGGRDRQRQLLDYLRDKEMLLLLDNLEHLLEGVDLILDLLRAAPGVKVLATSRVRLDAVGEQVMVIGGMDTPRLVSPAAAPLTAEEFEAVEGSDAVQMYLQSARRVRPDYAPGAEELHQVAQVCDLVDGMPLALLLAASWVEVLPPTEIGARIRQGLDFLAGELRGAPERQRSIQAVFDASWELLGEAERTAFARLSVFFGGFTADAAREVAGADLRTLRALVHKSFLTVDRSGRFGVHQLLRQFGDVRLAQVVGGKERAQDLHCSYYADFVAQRRVDVLTRRSDHVLAEIDNIRAAWRWAVERGKVGEIVRSFEALYYLYNTQGWFHDMLTLTGQAVDLLRQVEPAQENQTALGLALCFRARALAVVGEKQEALSLQPEGRSLLRELEARRELALCAYATVRGRLMGDNARSAELLQEVELLQEGLSLVRGMGAALETCLVLNTLAATFVNQGALGEAEPLYRESLQIAQEWDYPRLASFSLSGLGHVAYARGDYAEAKRRYEESLALGQQLGDSFWLGDRLKAIGDAELAMGDYQGAQEAYQASLARFDELADPLGTLDALCGLADVALAAADPLEAEQYYQRAVEAAVESGIVLAGLKSLVAVARWLAYKGEQARAAELTSLALAHGPFYTGWPGRPGAGQLLDELRAMLAPERFAKAEERGRELDLDQTLRQLLAELKS